MSQLLAAQTQFMSAMMQNMNNMMTQRNQTFAAIVNLLNQNNQAAAVSPPAHQHSKLSDYMRTRPSTFSHSLEPLEAEDWLRSVGYLILRRKKL